MSSPSDPSQPPVPRNAFIRWCERSIPQLTRAALAIVYLWFGLLKLAGVSPAADLVARTFFFIPKSFVVPALGAFEVAIAVGLLSQRTLKWALFGIGFHLLGTFLSFPIAPDRCFSGPFILTTEGEFVLKNLVTISAALFLAGHCSRRPLKP